MGTEMILIIYTKMMKHFRKHDGTGFGESGWKDRAVVDVTEDAYAYYKDCVPREDLFP